MRAGFKLILKLALVVSVVRRIEVAFERSGVKVEFEKVELLEDVARALLEFLGQERRVQDPEMLRVLAADAHRDLIRPDPNFIALVIDNRMLPTKFWQVTSYCVILACEHL